MCYHHNEAMYATILVCSQSYTCYSSKYYYLKCLLHCLHKVGANMLQRLQELSQLLLLLPHVCSQLVHHLFTIHSGSNPLHSRTQILIPPLPVSIPQPPVSAGHFPVLDSPLEQFWWIQALQVLKYKVIKGCCSNVQRNGKRNSI